MIGQTDVGLKWCYNADFDDDDCFILYFFEVKNLTLGQWDITNFLYCDLDLNDE